MTKLNFQHQLLQSLVSHCPSEIILICWFGPKETFLINNNAENSCIALSFCGQYVLGPWPILFITDLLKLRKVCKKFITVHNSVLYKFCFSICLFRNEMSYSHFSSIFVYHCRAWWDNLLMSWRKACTLHVWDKDR